MLGFRGWLGVDFEFCGGNWKMFVSAVWDKAASLGEAEVG